MPSTALDLCGLLRTAIRCDDPVLFLEHKHLYRQPYNRFSLSGPGLHDPVWTRAMVREGATSASSRMAPWSIAPEVAAAELERQGVSVKSSISVRYRLLTGRRSPPPCVRPTA